MACWSLRLRGYSIVARNVRVLGREVDVVARRGRTLVVVEVKARRGTHRGAAEEMVGERQRRRLLQAAEVLLAADPRARTARVDVVAVHGPAAAAHPRRARLTSAHRRHISSPTCDGSPPTLAAWLRERSRCGSTGITARRVDVEAHVADGVPAFVVVGLADRAVQEARQRVRSGIASAEFHFPSAG